MVYQSDCCYLPYSIHFSAFMPKTISRENGQNTKILQVRHFCMIWKWLPTNLLGQVHAQSINTERASLRNYVGFTYMYMYDFYPFFGVKTVSQCAASYSTYMYISTCHSLTFMSYLSLFTYVQNGFKCHTMSESHQRQLLLFAEHPDDYIDTFSKYVLVCLLFVICNAE